MIGRISGTLLEKTPPTICVDVGGVGYEIDVPMSTLYDLPETGQAVSLFTHLAVREDAQVLYGFLTAGERTTFRMLIKVTGIGARTALAVLSGLSVNDLATAIAEQDTAQLIRVPGIGKKTAERLLLELRGKFEASPGAMAAPKGGGQDDIVNALLALGYSASESRAAIKALPAGIPVSDGIRQALQALARK